MRKVTPIWFLLSLGATGGLLAYMQLGPKAGQTPPASTRPILKSPTSQRSVGVEPLAPPAQNTEQLALTISIASSIISAFAAAVQTWLTHQVFKVAR